MHPLTYPRHVVNARIQARSLFFLFLIFSMYFQVFQEVSPCRPYTPVLGMQEGGWGGGVRRMQLTASKPRSNLASTPWPTKPTSFPDTPTSPPARLPN
jgi:hypothetical protein